MALPIYVRFYFPDSEEIVSPQVFALGATLNMVDTRAFLNSQPSVGPLANSIPPRIRSIAPFGSVTPYNVEYTWQNLSPGSTSIGSAFNVSVIEGIPVGISANYTTGSIIYGLPLMDITTTYYQVLQYLASLLIGGTVSTLDISAPAILSNTYSLST